ncbi:M18 family aminopeptidase [Aquisalimonas lutea]|uniref:M18 family aminopeptidase n=1 Tax=Aquisalimonas lutea TaxID=1327750 RepID=UPI0025B43802|nr:M18 family aminopeptidase [Aquisalimonas lutea]MDN3517021.1 M18 family aminopeptidase [Aquisalimonas lutea]
MDNDNPRDAAARLLEFVNVSPSPWHAVASMCRQLDNAGFQRLEEREHWELARGGKYYVIRDDSTVAAFVVGQGDLAAHGYRIIGAHTDSPGFRIKPAGSTAGGDHRRAAVEIYGGPIVATFADRDLKVAGRVMARDPDSGSVVPYLYQSAGPVMRLPNAAIHLNRQVNQDGLRFQQHDELALILGTLHESAPDSDALRDTIAAALAVSAADILAWELAVADTQAGSFFGLDDEFIAAPQLDNLASCHAGLDALTTIDPGDISGVAVLACFDHEEVGSHSFKGAQGTFLVDVLQRIAADRGDDAGSVYHRALANSMVLSADMAHAYHPGFPGYYDAENRAMVNGGPTIKVNAQQRYSTDAGAEAAFMVLCDEAGVPCQKYVHRNDIPCGTTIGPITGASLGVRTVDVGNPMWSMHSIRESAGALDHARMIAVMRRFLDRPSLPCPEER